MFKVKTNPTFPATLTIVGQGVEQQLKLVYRHRGKDERDWLIDKVRASDKPFEENLRELVLDIVESWDADVELSAEGLETLDSYQPGAVLAIWQGYFQAMAVSRKGN